MKKILVSPKATIDLNEQALFIAQDNIQAAHQLYEACEETFKSLARMPHMGQIYPTRQKRLQGIRFFPISNFGKHFIFYIPRKDRIDIVRILYATRDIVKVL